MTHRTIAALVILTLAACSEDDQVPADAGIDVGAIADGAGDGEVPLVDGGPTVGADDAETADGDGAGAADGEADSANTPDTHEADAPFDGATVDAEDTTASVDVAPADGGADSNDGDTSSDVKVTVTPALIPLAQADFPLGVQAADPASDGALIWTRHDGWGPLRWLVLTDGADDEPGEVLASGVAQKVDGFAVVEVAGLPAGTPVRYLFTNDHDATSPDARRSPVGRFGTAPAPDELVEVTIGATSCVDVSQAPLGAIAAAADHPLDLFVWLGDTVYADGARTLEEYRDFWTESYVTSAYRALHGATSHVYTWDDHEVFNNWDPETVDPAHLAAATQAFFEHAPMRHPEEAPGRIWRSLRWGATLELFVLDCRSERLPSTKDTAAAQYISPEQLAWLIEGVQTSDAVFKVVANSVPITNMPPIYLGNDDRWEGYDAQRDAVLDAIGHVPGLVWIAGDFHFASVNGIEPPGTKYGSVWEILAGPGAKLQNPMWLVIGQGLYKDQFLWLDGVNNTVRLHLDPFPAVPTLTVEFVDATGAIAHTETLTYPE
ncbi:MAG: hypothetical protein AMXMBFR64_03980 [Myxococcales bacterium]